MTTSPDTKEINEKAIQELFLRQQKNARVIRNTTVKERIAKLDKLKAKILATRKELHEAVYKDFRKSPTEVDLGETLNVLSSISHTKKHLKKWMKPKKVPTPLNLIGTKSFIQYEAKGTVLIISPWNYPFNLAIDPLVYAIAAGNTAIIKPSEITPHTSTFIKQMISKIFDEAEVAIVEGNAQVAQSLLKKPFDHIFFTGSPALGKVIMKAAAENLTSVTLELGGKSPTIIDESANLKDAAYKVAYGKYLNCGQTCIAPDYVMVYEKVKEKFIKELKAVLKEFYAREEKDIQKSKDLPRIVNSRHFNRIKNLLDDAIKKGANIVEGGKTDAEDNYIAPTLLTEVNDEMEIMQEEIFGPLLPILSYKSLGEAVEYINTKPKPLALYIFEKNKQNRNFILKNTTAGGTSINETLIHIANPDLPFGGVNNSGIGKTHGLHGFIAFSNERAVLRRWGVSTLIRMMYPPYTEKVNKLLQRFIKMS